ncbi:SDR family oxidoreductase [Salinisphaera sp.]|uniref:SDR family oxidoreductase n=1 Tax=Salinisphaera sp. TaxID=1914330 RepID=UPI002D79FFB3|nr:SDR family oxidoreductase [Salinisphaera sp.]HET7313801.1 SDR family oxidoreductase [Salinisphaera sp.]
MNRILIVGATSAIAEAAARRFAERGDTLFLVARSRDKLDPVAQDLSVRGAARATAYAMDADDLAAHGAMLDAAEADLGGIDTAFIAYGTLPDQTACAADPAAAVAAWHTNAVSVIALVTDLANRMQAHGAGLIAVISSVAGDRGRASNYVYGSAKAGVNTFLDGLRHRLHGSGVDVLTIRPGLVDTPMTADLPKGPLFASADKVGGDIVAAIDKRRAVVYTPAFWRVIMTVIKAVPRTVFHRTKL